MPNQWHSKYLHNLSGYGKQKKKKSNKKRSDGKKKYRKKEKIQNWSKQKRAQKCEIVTRSANFLVATTARAAQQSLVGCVGGIKK